MHEVGMAEVCRRSIEAPPDVPTVQRGIGHVGNSVTSAVFPQLTHTYAACRGSGWSAGLRR
jgi:hypothetical protein